MRNFGGMEDFSVFDEFKTRLPLLRNFSLAENLIAEVHIIFKLCSVLPLPLNNYADKSRLQSPRSHQSKSTDERYNMAWVYIFMV